MTDDASHAITRLLGELSTGRREVTEELARLVYDDLLRIAMRRMDGRPGTTLEPGALVSECWMRLVRQDCDFENRRHFFAIASRLMIRVVLDADRRRAAERRGGGRQRVTLGFDVPENDEEAGVEVEHLREALERLETIAPRKAEVARLRGLTGLTIDEAAAELDVSPATVERDWSFARAWLSREISRMRGDSRMGDPSTAD
ncbi:MAG: ECF-type sigma factor [Planctomycetota bacterium]